MLFGFIVEFLCFSHHYKQHQKGQLHDNDNESWHLLCDFPSYLLHLYPKCFVGVILCLIHLCIPQGVALCLAYSKNTINIFPVTYKQEIRCANKQMQSFDMIKSSDNVIYKALTNPYYQLCLCGWHANKIRIVLNFLEVHEKKLNTLARRHLLSHLLIQSVFGVIA